VKRLLKRRLASLLAAALIAASWPATPALAQEVAPAAARAAEAGAAVPAAAGASALAPLALTIPSAADAPAPSPWNPAGPTVLSAPAAAPAQAPAAPAIGAASMPPVEGAASKPPVEGAASRPPAGASASRPAVGAASRPELDGSASRPAARAAALARRIADRLSWKDVEKDPGFLPPPADALDSLEQANLDVDPSRDYRASPEDWRDELIYSVFLDRFSRGAPDKTFGDPESGVSRQGGNLRGVIDRLDYIKGTGATTILLSPVTMTTPQTYHGYAPVHFLAVDPYLGTMADFKELVARAHAKGLRVVLDWVINHAGPVFEYADGKTQWTGDDEPGPVEWTYPLRPVELTADDFTRERVITNWNDPDQVIHGDFPPNYRHLATNRPETQEKLIRIAEWWMKESDIDGFRLDAVRHVDPSYLPRFSKEIRAYAARLGKKNFLLLGEDSTGIDAELKPYLANGSLDTLYDYPALRRVNYALHGDAPTRDLENSLRTSESALGPAADRLVRFIDLHDVYRFLLAGTPEALLKPAFAYLLASAGIPLVYYGTEQAFRQRRGRLAPEGGDLPADPDNRQDMFAGAFRPGVPAGNSFDENSSGYKFLRALADLRAAYPALRRGAQYARWSDPSGPGIYAFSRILDGQEVLVVLNTSAEARSADMWVDSGATPAGTELEDALDPGYRLAARAEDGGSKAEVSVPPHGVRILVRAR
jgi:glycosidase